MVLVYCRMAVTRLFCIKRQKCGESIKSVCTMSPSAPSRAAGPEEVRPRREQGPPTHHPPLPTRPGCGSREGCSDEVTGQFLESQFSTGSIYCK